MKFNLKWKVTAVVAAGAALTTLMVYYVSKGANPLNMDT